MKLWNKYLIEEDFFVSDKLKAVSGEMYDQFFNHIDEVDSYNLHFVKPELEREITEKFIDVAYKIFENIQPIFINDSTQYYCTRCWGNNCDIKTWLYVQTKDRNGKVWHNHEHSSTINAVTYYNIPKRGGEIEFAVRPDKTFKLKPQEDKIYIFPYYIYHRPLPQKDKEPRYCINLEIMTEHRIKIRGKNIIW